MKGIFVSTWNPTLNTAFALTHEEIDETTPETLSGAETAFVYTDTFLSPFKQDGESDSETASQTV